MAFARVPSETKGQIKKAGEILARQDAPLTDFVRAWMLADRWRACHAYPLNTFQATLRSKLGRYPGSPLAAQRLKRMPTIIDKLRRYPAMKLTTMQDIGGVRAIMATVGDVYLLADEFRHSNRLAHELVEDRDYIVHPRDGDGYRSLHLIYKYRNKQAPTYNDLRIELQLRTKLQHVWATAVETMGTLLGQALKSRRGDQEWLDFFALVSSAFAYRERRPLVPRFANLSRLETYREVWRMERALQALEKMKAFSVAVDSIVKDQGARKTSFYHLIVLNSLEHSVNVRGYDRANADRALADYSKAETAAQEGAGIEPVLVAAGSIDRIRAAYPNFFLDINAFAKIVSRMTRKVEAEN